jgi:hypothetical protein
VPTYFVRQNRQGSQGPFEESKVAAYIAAGRIRPGMELSTDGQRWVPVEEHRLFARAALPSVVPEPVEEIEEVPAADRPRRPARRTAVRSAPRSSSGTNAAAVVIGLLVVGGLGYVVVGGSKDADRSGEPTVRSSTPSAPVVEPPKSLTTRETKDAFRARWEKVHQEPDGKVFTPMKGMIWLTDAAAVKAKIESVSGRKPNRTQTIGGRNYWYYECADGLIQLVWWQDGIFNYTVNDY